VAVIDIAFEIASTGRAGRPQSEHLLHRLTALTARLLPGCCGAAITVWDGGRIVRSAVSHMDLAVLRNLPRSPSENPERQVMLRAEPVTIPDTLTPAKWRAYSTDAAGLGVRTVAIWPVPGSAPTTFGFYGSRPHAFHGADLALVTAQAAAVLQDADERDELVIEAHVLRASLESRSVIDQAAGILMAEQGGTPQQAFAELRRLSQHGNLRLADVAQGLVSRRSSGLRRAESRRRAGSSPGSRP
jgi:ANTAR domain